MKKGERAAMMREKYGQDYYKNIGAKGGSKQVPKGFSMNPDLAKKAGQKGRQNDNIYKK